MVEQANSLITYSDQQWRLKANCLGVDPDIFFPYKHETDHEAKIVCRGCVVQENCLEFALANPIENGIWGGKTADEREVIRKRRLGNLAM